MSHVFLLYCLVRLVHECLRLRFICFIARVRGGALRAFNSVDTSLPRVCLVGREVAGLLGLLGPCSYLSVISRTMAWFVACVKALGG